MDRSPQPSASRSAVRSWQRRASPLSRYALLAYTLIVIDASLYPFTGWRNVGIAAFAYLDADWPPRVLPFDLMVNALGYGPLGLLAGLALHPRVRGFFLVAGATLYCGALSAVLEATQTWLPARVASKSDLASNLVGGLIGALVAARIAAPLLDTGRLRAWRTRWFAPGASRGLVLIVIWLGALVYPDVFMLGMGGLLKAFDPDLADRIAGWVGFPAFVDPDATAARILMAETVVSALSLIGAGVLFTNLLRPVVNLQVRVALLLAFIVATVAVKSAVQVFVFGDLDGLPWSLPGARTGLMAGSAALLVLMLLPMRMRWAFGLAALAGSVALVNLVPDNPYANAVAASFTRGRLLNFYGLARGLNLAWPLSPSRISCAIARRASSPSRGGRYNSPLCSSALSRGWRRPR